MVPKRAPTDLCSGICSKHGVDRSLHNPKRPRPHPRISDLLKQYHSPLLPTTNLSPSTLIQLIQQTRARNQLSDILPLEQLEQIAREQLLFLTRVVLAALVALVSVLPTLMSVLLALVAVLLSLVPVVRLEPVVLGLARLDARMPGTVVRVLGTVVVQSVLRTVVVQGVLGTVVRMCVLGTVVEAVWVMRVRALMCAVFACHQFKCVVPIVPNVSLFFLSFFLLVIGSASRRAYTSRRRRSSSDLSNRLFSENNDACGTGAYGAARTGAMDAAATRTATSFVEKSMVWYRKGLN